LYDWNNIQLKAKSQQLIAILQYKSATQGTIRNDLLPGTKKLNFYKMQTLAVLIDSNIFLLPLV